MTTIGQAITIRGTEYRIVNISEDKGHLGSKYHGKRVFTLADSTGARFTVFGKRPTTNSRVDPVR